MTKIKFDPFFARPDGSRAQSAWLTKVQAAAKALAEDTAYNKLLPTNTQEENCDLVRKRSAYSGSGNPQTAVDLECLIQWYGPDTLKHLADLLDNKHVIKLVDSFHTEAVQGLLLGKLDQHEAREAVAARAGRWPLYTLRGLLAQNPSRDQPAAHLLQRLLYAHPEWVAALQAALDAEGDEAQAKTLARLLTPTEQVTEAGIDELPILLREPPWRAGTARIELPVLPLTPRHEPAVVDWSRWQGGTVEPRHFHWLQSVDPVTAEDSKALRLEIETKYGKPGLTLYLCGVKPERIHAVLAAGSVESGDWCDVPGYTLRHLNLLGNLDDSLALSLLRQRKIVHAGQYYEYSDGPDTCRNPVARLLKRFGAEHIDAVFAVMPSASSRLAQMVMEIVDWDELALHLSQYAYTVRSQLRGFAQRWLLEHPRTTARALIPTAFSDDPVMAAHARHHLYLLAQEGHGKALVMEAKAYGDQALAAVEQLLATPPEALLPAQLPKLPAWLVLPRLPRLLLAESGRAVPLANLPDALMPLALSKGGMAYAGLGKLQASVTPESLARLMLGLFEQWLENDMPPKERWILELQGRFGDDANARALAPRIREWRSRLDRVRSYDGLELLAQIGSDTALMLLSTFAEQKRYSDLQSRAAKALERVAEERGLTRDQLADRIVPLLDLEPNGRCTLDFGPRQFVLGLSADLSPHLADANGKALKSLPKPNAQDDTAKAKAASDFFKDFKKQLKTIASTQPPRLENAMCDQRRWPAGEFLPFFVQHPVMRHFAQRLLWAVFNPDGTWQNGFRIAEDASLADINDTAFTLPPTASEQVLIGLPHPLTIPPEAREKWQLLFADYEILPPFEQMARQTFALSAEEAARADLPNYAGRKVGTGSLLGLENRGWKRQAGDGGVIDHFDKRLTDDLEISLLIDGGWFIAGPPPSNESHTVRAVCLAHPNRLAAGTPSPCFADLPAITVSEVLRDLEKMAWHIRD